MRSAGGAKDGKAGGAGPGGETLAAVVERVTYHDPESGFAVVQVRVGSRRDTLTVVGRTAAEIHPGEILHAEGSWGQDPVYGAQFKAQELRIQPPDSSEGIEKYLASGA